MCFQHFHFLNSCSLPWDCSTRNLPSEGRGHLFLVKFDAGLGSPAWHFSATVTEPFYSKWKAPSPLLRAPEHLPAQPPPCRDVRRPHAPPEGTPMTLVLWLRSLTVIGVQISEGAGYS